MCEEPDPIDGFDVVVQYDFAGTFFVLYVLSPEIEVAGLQAVVQCTVGGKELGMCV